MTPFKPLDQYIGGQQRAENPYPNEYIDPKLKLQKEYALAYGKAMVADYANNACELPYTFTEGKRSFKTLHEYATGTYSNEKLKDSLIGRSQSKKKNGKHITKMSISFSTFPVISKIYDVAREKNMRQPYDIDSFCLDDDSIQAKEADKEMMKYLVQEDTQEFLRRTKFKPNVQINPQALGILTEADVDLYFECGAYVFERELASIAACNKTKLVSNYKVVQDATFDNFIKYGVAVWKNEIDRTTGTVKIVNVPIYDPELGRCPIILPFSTTNNFENLSRIGWFRTSTIKDIRQRNPELTAAELIYMAQCFTNLNPEYTSIISAATQSNGMADIDPLNRCKILILDYQWLGVDIENYVKNDSRTLFKAVDFNYEVTYDRKRKGDKLIQKKVIKKFAAEMVVGTDIILKCGPAEDIIYYGPDGDRCPGLDFFAAKTGNISPVERSIAIQDDIDLANTKLRNAIASAVPAPRMVIQTGLLDNVFLNNIKQQPEDNMATFRELGYLMVNAVDDNGKPIFTNQKLVDFLPMGIMEDVNVFTGQILSGINNLREIWGLAQGADGSTPQKYDGAKKTELAATMSNAALFPTFNSFQYLYEDAFNDVVKKWQIIAKGQKLKVSYAGLGQKNMRILALDDKFTNADLNISMILGATDQQLNELMDDIKQLRALGVQTGFNQGITTSEYIYLSETIRSGNTKQAMWVMAKVEQKKIAAQQVIDQQNQQNNIAGQQNSAAQAEINKQDTAKITGQQNRLTIILQEAEKRKTAAVSGILKAFDKEGGPSAEGLYEKIMADANAEVIGILKQDEPQQAPDQQQGQQQMPPPGGDPGQQNQQQVA